MSAKTYRPDHNGECLTCDEGAEAHEPPAAQAKPQRTDHGAEWLMCDEPAPEPEPEDR